MMKHLILFLGLVFIVKTATSQPSIFRTNQGNSSFRVLDETILSSTPLDTIHFLWLWGQSNAEGRADTSQIPSSLDYVNLNIDSCLITNGEAGTITPIAYQAGITSYADPGEFGPELSLLDTISKITADTTYLFKTTLGGTTLAEYWLTGQGSIDLAREWRHFQDWARGEGKTLVCDAFIMMQGEQDAVDTTHAVAYGDNLAAFIDTIRSYTGEPDLPMIIGEVNGINDPTMVYRYSVRQGQYAVARYEISDTGIVTENAYTRDHTYLVDTDTYTFLDVVHYDATSTIQFGWDIYKALQEAGVYPNIGL